MILGKTCYTLGNMPFARFSYENLKYNDDYVISVYDLNFLFFCYYVPYSLCLDNDYLKFRLSNPSEIEIYLKHYNYIIYRYTKNKSYNFDKTKIRNKYIIKKSKIDFLNNKIVELNDRNKKIMTYNSELQDEIKNIINSKSWKLTKPLRKMLFYINKNK